jgi:hypothetical protein
MNPWALVVIGIGVLLLIMGVKGSYGNVEKAITGHGTSATTPVNLGGLLGPIQGAQRQNLQQNPNPHGFVQ